MTSIHDWISHDALTFVIAFLAVWLMFRTDRLGRQMEAVMHVIQLEITRHDDERQRELREMWKSDKEEGRKERRMQWIGGGIMVAIAIGWSLLSR